MLCFACLRLQFRLNRKLREARRVLLLSIRVVRFAEKWIDQRLVPLVNVLGKLKKRSELCVYVFA